MSNQIYIFGDIHQSFKPIRDLYNTLTHDTNIEKHPSNTDTLILLGDSGANFFFNYRDQNFKKKLGRYNFTYFIIRGNHDARASVCADKNPDAWHEEEYFGNTVLVENDYPYIKYAQDKPAIYYINEYKTLVIPGAYSVDKNFRIKYDLGWFEDEQLTEEEMGLGEALAANNDIDMVLSHTCPLIYQPTDLFLSVVDQSTVDTTMERYLGKLERDLDYKLWCWGHFHKLRVYPKFENRQCVMLSNDAFVNLTEYQKNLNSNIYDNIYLIKYYEE